MQALRDGGEIEGVAMNRRDVLKAMIGMPVALIAGGKIIEGGGTFEEHGETGLVVPRRDLKVYSSPPAAGIKVAQVWLSEIYQRYGVQFDVPPVLVGKSHDLWIHIEQGEDATALLEVVIGRAGDEFTVSGTKVEIPLAALA